MIIQIHVRSPCSSLRYPPSPFKCVCWRTKSRRHISRGTFPCSSGVPGGVLCPCGSSPGLLVDQIPSQPHGNVTRKSIISLVVTSWYNSIAFVLNIITRTWLWGDLNIKTVSSYRFENVQSRKSLVLDKTLYLLGTSFFIRKLKIYPLLALCLGCTAVKASW